MKKVMALTLSILALAFVVGTQQSCAQDTPMDKGAKKAVKVPDAKTMPAEQKRTIVTTQKKYYSPATSFRRAINIALRNKEDLGLTDGQVKQLSDLSAEVNRSITRNTVEANTLSAEINTMMWESPADIEAINNLVAEKYEFHKQNDQFLVSAHDKMKKILTAEQAQKVKDLMNTRLPLMPGRQNRPAAKAPPKEAPTQ